MKTAAKANNTEPQGKGTLLVKDGSSRDFRIVLLLTLIHIPLGVALYNTGSAGIIHPYLIFAFGMYLALKRESSMASIALVIAYIIGGDVLWRMASVPIFWEFSKFGSAVIILTAMIRRNKFDIPNLALIYFILLIPGCILIFSEVDFSKATDRMSFYMSGPLLLFLCCWFFHGTQLSQPQFRRFLIALILPLLSAMMAAMFYTVSAEEIYFTSESNFTTSGGFGPNQVSAMLGLGLFASVAGIILFKKGSLFSIYFGVLALAFATQCMLTFSRGGMYNALGGIAAMLMFGSRDIGSALRRFVPALILAGLFIFFIYPVLDNFTGGQLQERFEDTGTTHRAEIAESDYAIFLENPLFGIGVGSSYNYRERFLSHKAISHTEFARMISEHGGLGLFALVCMFFMILANLKRANSVAGKAFVAGSIGWSVLFMMNTGMRLSAPSLMWGLSFITVASFGANVAPSFNRIINRSTQHIPRTRRPKQLATF